MNETLRKAVEASLYAKLGAPVAIRRTSPVGGGCINETEQIVTDHGSYFVKSRADAPAGFFQCERRGLEAILASGAIRAPRPIADSAESPQTSPFLVLEFIESQPAGHDYDATLARQLASLHRVTSPTFGLDHDNHIGLTPQSNAPCTSWPEFFATRRLEFQLQVMESKSRATAELRALLARLVSRLDSLIGAHQPEPSLIHGDLWSGNVMTDETGGAVIVDPAIYYGDREADIAMTELFGAFGDAFYKTYNEVWPLPDGHEDRKEIYNLYHLMNHVNLFGLSYLSGVLGILRRFA